MLESLRGRLLVWYTAILAVVIAAFGGAVTYLAWRSRVADIDAAHRARAHAIAGALQPATAGTFDLTLPPAPAGAAGGPLYHVLWDARGRLIDRSDPDLELAMPVGAGSRTRDGRREHVVRAATGATVLVGRDLAGTRAELWSLAGTLSAVSVAALALAVGGGWWLAGRTLAPIGRISRTARAMVDGDFTARIPIDRVETELGQLARALNDAFDRLHESLERQRRFTADASHELRTPLSTISTELQWALGAGRVPGDYRESQEACLRAVGRMESIVTRLLALARADAGAGGDRRIPVRIADVARQAVRDLSALAARRNLTVTTDIDAETAASVIVGDADRLLEATSNVLANAIQYNVDSGRVRLHLTRTAGTIALSIADSGVGIAAADLPHVFDPFFRADPARSREAGGAGLGLAVARAIIVEHGGAIRCESQPNAGTTVTMTWPLSDGAPGLPDGAPGL
jgi:two-component system OmpR family sensor kinase